VDAELNRVYRTLVAKRKDDAAAVEKLKKFERAWIAYRDACFGAAYPAANKQQYGSIYPMEVDFARRQTDATADWRVAGSDV